MARKIDELGRIVLPVELRRLHDIHPGDALAISVDGDTIVLRKVDHGCIFCGGATALTMFRSRTVCSPCITQLGAPDGASSRGGAPAASALGATDAGLPSAAADRHS